MSKRTLALVLAVLVGLSALPALGEHAPARDAAAPAIWRDDLRALDAGSGEDVLAMAAWQHLLLIARLDSGTAGGIRLTLYDMQAGEALAAIPLDVPPGEGFDLPLGFLADGRPYLIDTQRGQVQVYDRGLAVTDRLSVPREPQWLGPWVEPSGKRLWFMDHLLAEVVSVAVDTGERTVIRSGLPGGWQVLQFRGVMDGALHFDLIDAQGHEVVCRWDMATGRLSLWPVLLGFSLWPGTLRSYQQGNGSLLVGSLFDGEELMGPGIWREGEQVLDIRGALLAGGLTGGSLRLYDLERGLLINELPCPPGAGDGFLSAMLLDMPGQALLTYWGGEGGATGYYLWDYLRRPLDADARLHRTTMAQVREGNDALAARIEQAYGVRVQIREAGVRFHNDTYASSPALDEGEIRRGLEAVDAFCAALPGGMLREAMIPPHDQLSFYLCSGLLSDGGHGIPYAAAVMATWNNERYVAFNTYESDLVQTLSHEFSHLLEDRLYEHDLQSGGSTLADWELLSPLEWEDGGYAYSYRDEEGNQLYDTAFTAEEEGATDHPGRVWYIDAYARTFPLEDRARTFELLFMAQDALPDAFLSPHVMRKAQYLCHLIRQAFPSVQHAPALPWERLLPADDTDWEAYMDSLRRDNAA